MALFLALYQSIRLVLFIFNVVSVCLLHSSFMVILLPLKWIIPSLHRTLESFVYSKCGEAMLPIFTSIPQLRIHSDSLSVLEKVANQKAVIMANHQDSGDVPVMMNLMTHFRNSHSATWIMDRMFRWTPFGIPCRWHNDFFSAEGSKQQIVDALRAHFSTSYFNDGRKWVVMFPEGGYLKNRGESARRFAAKNDLPVLYNCCLPRATAFVNIVQSFRGEVCPVPDTVEHVIDVTIAYTSQGVCSISSSPADNLNLSDVVYGTFTGKEVFINFRHFKLSEIPTDEEELTDWLYERYKEKEEMLTTFREKGVFSEEAEEFEQLRPSRCHILGALSFWYISAFFLWDFYHSIAVRALSLLTGLYSAYLNLF